MAESTVKEQARELVERLDDDASWEDFAYLVYLQRAVARGLRESSEGRGIELPEARRRFGIAQGTGSRARRVGGLL